MTAGVRRGCVAGDGERVPAAVAAPLPEETADDHRLFAPRQRLHVLCERIEEAIPKEVLLDVGHVQRRHDEPARADFVAEAAERTRAARVSGRSKATLQLDLYNALNSNVVLQENQNYGSSLGQPQQVLQGRLLRISNQIKF